MHAGLAGDDTIDVGGQFYTIVQFLPSQMSLILATGANAGYNLGVGDTINVYTPGTFHFLGSATLASSLTVVNNPGIPSGTINSVFGGSFSGDTFYQV